MNEINLKLGFLREKVEIKKIFIFTLLFFSLNSNAVTLKKLHSDSKYDVYFYNEKIKKKGKFIYTRLMINYLEPIYPKSTVLMKLKLDCKKNKITLLSRNRFTQKNNDFLGDQFFGHSNFLSDSIQKKIIKKIC